MVGVVISTVAIGATLNAMNKGLEEFRPASTPWDLSLPHEGVQNQGAFTRREFRVTHAPGAGGRTAPAAGAVLSSDMRRGSSLILLNALGSRELADGKYLYNPLTRTIEVQWIQGIGSEKAAAPQARLMATVINGILTRQLPWGLVLLGVFLVVAVELLGIRSLSFAVGAYLSIATTLAIFAGGVVRWMVDRAAEKAGAGLDTESEISPGSLYASGLIAAGGIVGLLGVVLKLYEAATGHVALPSMPHTFLYHDGVSVLMFALLAFSLYYFARKPLPQA
jgi:hypothetical protein